MSAFIKAAFLVVVAEMGDKTQLLAMAMASKYQATKVLIGVFIATILNHAFAVLVGSLVGEALPINQIKLIAAISFLIFGLWTLRGDKLDKEEEKKSKFGPIMTVAIAFFVAEMGDKTQLMTVAIAAENKEPLAILMGTTTGMMIADGIGILGGAWMAKNVPERYIKWAAGLIFIFFGTLTLYESVPKALLTPTYIMVYFVVIALCIYVVGAMFAYEDQMEQISSPRKTSKRENRK